MRLFGAVAAAVLISVFSVGPVLAQVDDPGYDDPGYDDTASASDLLSEAAFTALDEKVAEKCDCSAGLDKYEACVAKQVTSATSTLNQAKKFLKLFGLKKADIASILQDEGDLLVAACDEELSGGGEDPSDGGDFPDDSSPEF